MIISNNLNAMFTNRELNIRAKNKSKSIEKLSSGININKASDNAASLSISEKMRSLIRGLNQGSANVQDGISLCQIADGALAEVQDIIHRMDELAVQASNDTNTEEDRSNIQAEISELVDEINNIGDSTQFNKINIFNGSCSKVNETITGSISAVTVTGTPALDITTDNKSYLPYNPSEMTMFADNSGLWFEYKRSANEYVQYDKMTWDELGVNSWGDAKSKDVYNCTYLDAQSGFTMNFAVAKAANKDYLINSLNNVKVNIEYDFPFTVKINGISPIVKYSNIQNNINELSLFNYLDYPYKETSGLIASGRIENAYSDTGALPIRIPYQAPYIMFSSHKGTTDIISDVNNAITAYIQGGSSTLSGTWSFYDNYESSISFEYEIDLSSFEAYRVNGSTPDAATITEFDHDVIIGLTNDHAFELYDTGQPTVNYSLDITSPDVTYSFQNNQGLWIQAGAGATDGFLIGIDKMNASVLGINKLNVLNRTDAASAIDIIQNALNIVSSSRSSIGATQNRLEYILNNNKNMAFSLQTAEARIRDTDMAKEMLQLAKENILEQVGQAMSAQANQDFRAILKLFE